MTVDEISIEQRATARRQLLEIYCTLMPAQAPEVRQLLSAGVPISAAIKLYPYDWELLQANFSLHASRAPLDTITSLVNTYFRVEDDLEEVEGGVYGSAGKIYSDHRHSKAYLDAISHVLRQLPEHQRDGVGRNLVGDTLDAVFWYSWSLDHWAQMTKAHARKALIDALAATSKTLQVYFDAAYCDLSEGTS